MISDTDFPVSESLQEEMRAPSPPVMSTKAPNVPHFCCPVCAYDFLVSLLFAFQGDILNVVYHLWLIYKIMLPSVS